MLQKLLRDERGFVISAELVLVATLLVVGLIVGLSEVQHSMVAELNDVGNAIGKLNQSYSFSGFSKRDGWCVHAFTRGSSYADTTDDCDCNQCDLACDDPVQEGPKGSGK
jgi:Flp pilus assembly pilin Flp